MTASTSLEDRVLRLEREVRWLQVAVVAGLLIVAAYAFIVKEKSREIFVTDSLMVPTEWYAGPFANIASSTDGKDIVMSLGELRSNRQIRIGIENNAQALKFTDARDKLRIWLGIAEDGSARLRLFDASGKETWSSDENPSVSRR
jgi:hypothetical protein